MINYSNCDTDRSASASTVNNICSSSSVQLFTLFTAINVNFFSKGSVPDKDQDCFMYRVEHGVASFLLDDDNCDCLSTLSVGHGMCMNNFSPNYGTEYSFGVDLLYDPGCVSPSPDHGLILFFKGINDFHFSIDYARLSVVFIPEVRPVNSF